MEKEMEETVTNIRAALISTKEKCDLKSLSRDYKMIIGEDIPYRRYGYKTLEEFLASVPSLQLTKLSTGQTIVTALPNKKVQHIMTLVEKQKYSKRKSNRSILSKYSSSSQGVSSGRKCKNLNKQATAQMYQKQQSQTVSSRVAHKSVQQPVIPLQSVPRQSTSFPTDMQNAAHTASTSKKYPPIAIQLAEEAGKPIKLMRSQSSPLDGTTTTTDLPQSKTLDLTVGGRKRMRSQGSTSNLSPTFITPAPTNIQRPSPQIEKLKQDAISSYCSNSPVWSWSSSEDSFANKNSTFEQWDGMKKETKEESKPLPEEILIKFAKERKLPEPVFTLIVDDQNKNLVVGSVKIGSYLFSSYPSVCRNAQEARNIAAERALEDLQRVYKRKSKLISDEKDILERIPPMIQSHYHGLWATEVACAYEEKYKEQVPPNWLSLLDTLPNFSVEQAFNNHVIKYTSSTESVFSSISVPPNKLTYNEAGWTVEITCAISTVEIWCRCLELVENKNYEKMISDMKVYYTNTIPIPNAVVGLFYAVSYQDIWCRVRAMDVSDEGVMCFFVDYGDEYLISHNKVFPLAEQFTQVQAQAFVCRLSGLEELVNLSCMSTYLEQLVGSTFLALPDKEPRTINGSTSSISVVLQDLCSNQNVNSEIMTQAITESVNLKLVEGCITNVYVCHADRFGNIYIQVQSEGAELFQTITNQTNEGQITPDMFKNYTLTDSTDQIYLTKWKEDAGYYRCKIVDRSPCGKYAQIYFIDYGNDEIVTVADSFIPAEEVSKVLAAFPPEAIKIRTDIPKEKVPVDFVDRVLAAMPSNKLVILKVLKYDKDGVPICDLFLRAEIDNHLYSVTTSLQLESEISNKDNDDGNNNYVDKTKMLTEKLERLKCASEREDKIHQPVPSTGMLVAPKLPKVNAYFDVRVPEAVNPWNFFVQPYDSYRRLEHMMNLLQKRYNKATHSRIQIKDVIPGMIYASQYEDGLWYRTCVIKVIHSGSISVFYCDYGYYANLRLDQLHPLDSKFLELPYQAVKAKLSGIEPRSTKWSVDDCKFFKKLVCGKLFVSILTSIQKDELYKCDVILNMKLVETRGPDDIFIDRLLIEKGIADPDPSNI